MRAETDAFERARQDVGKAVERGGAWIIFVFSMLCLSTIYTIFESTTNNVSVDLSV